MEKGRIDVEKLLNFQMNISMDNGGMEEEKHIVILSLKSMMKLK